MISVIIPTLNAETELVPTLAALVPATVAGLVGQVVISDGGSRDGTLKVAELTGCDLVTGKPGRGGQLARGADCARHDWLLFLHADTVLQPGWQEEVERFLGRPEAAMRAGVFGFRLADHGWRPRLIEAGVALRCALLALPYGDQGLLISRALYREIGGFSDISLMEDVEMVRRLGRRRLYRLRAIARTGAGRYRRDGYFPRVLRNWFCLALYFAGVHPDRIVRLYR